MLPLREECLSFCRSALHCYLHFCRFALPLCAAYLNAWRFASVDITPITHIRRGRTIEKRYRNGLLSKEEELLVRQRLMLAMGLSVDDELFKKLDRASMAQCAQVDRHQQEIFSR